VSFERTSNEVTDAIDGVTLNLLDQGTDVNISVDKDIGSVTKKVQSFVNAFNQANGFIEQQSDYNKDKDQAGPLMGSTVARSAESRMTNLLMEPISGTSDDPYQYLSQVGFEFQRDGSLSFDSTAFQEAMEKNPQAVEKLFVGDSGAAGKLENALKEGFTKESNGSVPNTIESIGNRIERINEQIDQEKQDLQDYRERQVQKFSNMEKAIMKYQSIESQLGNWLDLGKDEKA
jgi:flagellar hook-associated protein 2